MPAQPLPIDGFIFDHTGAALADAIVNIYNLKNGQSIEIKTDSSGLFFIDLQNYATTFSYENGDPGLIRAHKEGLLFQFGEEHITFDTGIGSITQSVQLSGQFPKQPKSIDPSQIDLIEHEPVEDAKKVIRVDDILRKYKPADDDNDSNPEYSGFTDRYGNWYIEKFDSDDGSHRYAKGTKDYVGNFKSRSSLNYDYFHKVF